MDCSEQVPNERATLKYKGEEVAEAWYEGAGESTTLVFRVPRDRLQLSDQSRRLTIENLLIAAAIPIDEIQSWRLIDASHTATIEADAELNHPLPPPAPDATHLTVCVQLKSPAQEDSASESIEQEIPLEQWQALEACWKAVLSLEACIDTSRLGMDSLRAEMETAFRRAMTVEEKLNALQSDVAQWTKAKSRVHHALPKVREFIHRAIWALAVPERKRLEEIVKKYIEPRNPFPMMDQVRKQLEHLQKDRQVLLAQGNAVYQECRAIAGEIQRAFSVLQRNAADNARRKRSASREKGKHF